MKKIELTADEIKVIKQQLNGEIEVWNADDYQQKHRWERQKGQKRYKFPHERYKLSRIILMSRHHRVTYLIDNGGNTCRRYLLQFACLTVIAHCRR